MCMRRPMLLAIITLAILFVYAAVIPSPTILASTSVSGEISGTVTWGPEGSPYIVSYLTIRPGATLTILAGTVVRMPGWGSSITVNGTLRADGVTFTSDKATPAPGDWGGIVVNSGGAAELLNSVLEYGGSAAYYVGGSEGLVKVTGGNLSMAGCTARESAYWGLYVTSGTVSVTGSVFTSSARMNIANAAGFTVQDSTVNGSVAIANCDATLTGNTMSGGLSFSLPSGCRTVTLNGNTLSRTGGNPPLEITLTHAGVNLQGTGNTFSPGTIGVTGSVGLSGSTVYLPSPVSLGAAAYRFPWLVVNAGTTLQLAPATVCKMPGWGSSITVNGTLRADGVTFTSDKATPAPGDWGGIVVNSGGAAELLNSVLEYGGSAAYYVGGSEGLVKVTGGSCTMFGCRVTDSAYYGVRVAGGSLDLSYSEFSRNAVGVSFGGSDPWNAEVHLNSFSGNTSYGLRNDLTYLIDATSNWWGSSSGPNPPGTGDNVWDPGSNLSVFPWLDSLPPPPAANDPYEPNGSVQQAYDISQALAELVGGAVSYIGWSNDVDWFRFTAPEGGEFCFSLSGNESGADPYSALPADYNLGLYDLSGTLLVASPVYGSSPEFFYYSLVTNAVYYVKVSGATANDYSSAIPYKLYIAKGDCQLTLEAARYRDMQMPLSVYVREYWDAANPDIGTVEVLSGMPYSYGSFDRRDQFLTKLSNRAVANWSEYGPPRPGRFKDEYDLGDTAPQGWMGIDCAAFVQRCSDEVLASSGNTQHRYTLSTDHHLSTDADGANLLGATGVLHEHCVLDQNGAPIVFDPTEACVGDLVGFSSADDPPGFHGHVAMLLKVNRQTPAQSILIHATSVFSHWENGVRHYRRLVQESSWSDYIGAQMEINRLQRP
jgi:hypothetical protein